MFIGFIGAGKVGTALGRYFAHHGLSVAGFFDVNSDAAQRGAAHTSSQQFSSVTDLINAADLIFFTVPDTLITSTWQDACAQADAAGENLTNKIVAHCSGCMTSDAFTNASDRGARACSVHPLLALSDPLCPLDTLASAHVTLEGDASALASLQSMLAPLGNPLHLIAPADKTLYHAAAVFASNLVLAPLATAARLMQTCGFSEHDAREALRPLILGNAQAFCDKGAVCALTGPVERNDLATAAHHLDALERDTRATEIYCTLTQALVDIAQDKHPDRNYADWNPILNRKANR